MNDIIKFLNFEDDDLETDPPYVKNGKRFITIRKSSRLTTVPSALTGCIQKASMNVQ